METTQAPVEETKVEAVAPVEATVETPVESKETPTVYELPDGAKVDAATLHTSYKNLLSDYTRKAQELSAIKGKAEDTKAQEPEWKKPDWEPKSYQEILSAAEERIQDKAREASQKEQEQRQALDQYVQAEIAELKKIDPKVDENLVMAHAAKLGVNSLLKAHENLKEFERREKLTEERVLKNLKNRAGDPVGSPGGGSPGISVPKGMGAIEGARYALQQLQS